MKKTLLLGWGRWLLPLPGFIWKKRVNQEEGHSAAHLAFMSEDHHRVRNFAVFELPRAGKPLSPGLIASELKLPIDQVVSILDDLEVHMTFLYRDEDGAVEWAYPVTTAQTPHRITFNTGERIYAA